MAIRIHTAEEFEAMDKVGALTAEALDLLEKEVKPGITTDYLDKFVADYASSHNIITAPLNYKGYPKSICTSINHVVCHGIPSSRKLRNGDIVGIDVTLIVDGWHGDSCRMYQVGEVSVKAKKIIDVTYRAMTAGIEAVKPGNTLKDIAIAVQTVAHADKCSVVEDFGGHGIGRNFHDEPHIFNYVDSNYEERLSLVLKPGMFFTVEPMINIGKSAVKMLKDGWTVVTRDRSLSAQFEHTVGVTETGCKVFTRSRDEKPVVR